MSTQSAQSILFTHTAPQQGIRLLELPPEVADLLTSANPPTLYLKSPATNTNTTTATKPTETHHREYVNLCTPTQTYRIRQVQSSNSLHILQPSTGGEDVRRDLAAVVDLRAAATRTQPASSAESGEVDGGDMLDNNLDINLAQTVTTIAKCGSTLELHVPENGFGAAEFLSGGALGLLRRFQLGDDTTGFGDRAGKAEDEDERALMETIFADVPVSRAECERAWVQACAFLWRGVGWVPSSEAKMGVWKRVVEGALVQGIDLRAQFLVEDLWGAVCGEDDDGDEGPGPCPRALFEAVVRRVDGDENRKLGEGLKWAGLDKEACVRWVGETYLEAMAPTAGDAIGRTQFLTAWKDHLPEAWREEVALSKLTDSVYKLPDPTSICFVTEFERQRAKKNLPTDASASTAAKKSRNWHELFKNQKRQKR
ncbi:putative sister chromatid cohesion protein Dcc1 [Aspergillus homomorphus CBS 101889]|uniref:Sister chromatid cohesion protein Dcc1 n=1 Tax=Aspergillus homomorphus (strain CBS 101889) TaxID=1450537 RepID=A0A395I4E0_ASPHC|nr:hypothetical protein BO97DRAFT_422295 [Aspergillus homomorphus CBS 101889]RAL14950.1 hypothetical protein BO97DRAFT_422295 [Aspergillus homomorphus CBS 101889]